MAVELTNKEWLQFFYALNSLEERVSNIENVLANTHPNLPRTNQLAVWDITASLVEKAQFSLKDMVNHESLI